MSDQADNLRRLVRARREWREAAVAPASQRVDTSRAVRETSVAPVEQGEVRARPAPRSGGLLTVLAARWALARADR